MNDHWIVLPAIDPGLTRDCIESMAPKTLRRVVLVDNTADGALASFDPLVRQTIRHGRNLGVAASWNAGCRSALDSGARFVTICSTSMRFDGDGGDAWCRTADLAAENRQWPFGFESLNGWHLITFGRQWFDAVGWFDETFHPAYFEDNDAIWRARAAGVMEPPGGDRALRQFPWIGALRYRCEGDGLSARRAGVEVPWEKLRGYYTAKWGGLPGAETSCRAFEQCDCPDRRHWSRP